MGGGEFRKLRVLRGFRSFRVEGFRGSRVLGVRSLTWSHHLLK